MASPNENIAQLTTAGKLVNEVAERLDVDDARNEIGTSLAAILEQACDWIDEVINELTPKEDR